jgi:SAM-dependent methyltransferase
MRLLHVAPERSLVRYLSTLENLEYLTADISGRNVMVPMDLTHIQYPTDYFGAIICNHVLEHIPDDRQAMSELFRVLKPGGWAILQVPLSNRLRDTLEDPTVVSKEDRERVFGQDDHVRIYAADYSGRLESVGFRVEKFRWWRSDERFGGAANRYGLLKDEILYVARKQ